MMSGDYEPQLGCCSDEQPQQYSVERLRELRLEHLRDENFIQGVTAFLMWIEKRYRYE